MRLACKSILISLAAVLFGASLLLADGRQPETLAKEKPQGPTIKPQSTCPVMGGTVAPLDKAQYVDVKGKRIYICCAACEDAIRANPDMYIKKIEQRGETVADTPKANSTPSDKKARN